MGSLTLRKAVELANKGVVEDTEKNYEEAVRYYDNCIGYFMYAKEYEIKADRQKKRVEELIKDYQHRANCLKMKLVHKEVQSQNETVEKMENLDLQN